MLRPYTTVASARLKRLLGGDVDGGFGVFPGHAEGAAGAGVIEGDGEVFHRGGELGNFHVDAGEVVAWAGIRGTPFAGFFADDELPFVGVGHGEDGVAAGGNVGASDVQVGVGDEGGRFIRAGAPHLPVGDECAENFASLHARARVSDLDGLAAGELAFGVGGRTGAAGFVLRASGERSNGETTNEGTKLFEHDFSPR